MQLVVDLDVICLYLFVFSKKTNRCKKKQMKFSMPTITDFINNYLLITQVPVCIVKKNFMLC